MPRRCSEVRCAPCRPGRLACVALVLALTVAMGVDAAEWVRPLREGDAPVWGLKGGLQFAIYPGGFGRYQGGPRGLIRLGYPVLPEGGFEVVNFVAVEPVVGGLKGLSELEQSRLDGVPGLRFWSGEQAEGATPNPGRIVPLPGGGERLEVTFRVEKFENGAHVYLVVAQQSDRPDEVEFTIHTEDRSAPLEYCILTATMGNFVRTRELWLKDQTASSLALYGDYQGRGFAPHTLYPLQQLHRTSDGDVLAAITTDEKNPAAVYPFPGRSWWHYGGVPVTQYWRKPHDQVRDDLQVAVNARYCYWRSFRSIPGGPSFENFEMRERFYEGQRFAFGITTRPPEELGLSPVKAAPKSE